MISFESNGTTALHSLQVSTLMLEDLKQILELREY